MTDAARRYEELTRQLLEGRARGDFEEGTPGEALEDELLEEMDDCWWEMSDADRQEAERQLEESRSISAPEILDAIDVALPDGAKILPRRMAA